MKRLLFRFSNLVFSTHYIGMCSYMIYETERENRLVYRTRYRYRCHGNLTTNTGAQVFAIEAPGAANFMTSQLAGPHQTIEGRAAHTQIAHRFFKGKQNIILKHLYDHDFSP